MPLPKRAARVRKPICASDGQSIFLLKVYHAAGKKASLFFTIRAFSPLVPPFFPPAPASHRGEKAFARFSHRFSRPRFSRRPSHPPPHRTAAKRRLHAFRTVFFARVFLTVLLTPLFSLFSEKVLTKGRKLAIIIRQTTKRRSAVLHGEVLKRSKRRPC